MVKLDILRGLQLSLTIKCPVCGKKLYVVGLPPDSVLWCDECKVAWGLEFRKTKFTEKDLKDVAGFPDKKRKHSHE